jgi:hypothetical protein
MDIKELINVMQDLAQAAPGAKTRNPKAGLLKAVEALKGMEHPTAAAQIDAWKAAQKPARKAKASAALRNSVVAEVLGNLQAAADFDRFMGLLKDIGSNKQVRVVELRAIAKSYLGAAPNARTKAAVLAALERSARNRFLVR